MTYCERCKRLEICERVEKGIAHSCVGFTPKKTNADRIRSMSDDDLAEFMCHSVSPSGTINCSACEVQEFCHAGQNGYYYWLRQEAEENGDPG